jgi:hypothetical protein
LYDNRSLSDFVRASVQSILENNRVLLKMISNRNAEGHPVSNSEQVLLKMILQLEKLTEVLESELQRLSAITGTKTNAGGSAEG